MSKKKPQINEKLWDSLSQPMLASLSNAKRIRENWFYELKYDGYRIISKIRDKECTLISRNQNVLSDKYPSICKELSQIHDDVILDGELIIQNKNGVSDFQRMQQYDKKDEKDLWYFVFDILYLNGHSTCDLKLSERKELLDHLMLKYKFKRIKVSNVETGDGQAFFEKAINSDEEGIIAKNPDSRYVVGQRSDNWLKYKPKNALDAFICGYTEPQNSRKYFGSLILGLKMADHIKFIGNVGSGFNSDQLKEIYEQLTKLEQKKSPFAEKVELSYSKGTVHWVKPQIVAEIEYASFTNDHHLRHPVFKGIRKDKNQADDFIDYVKESADKKPSNNKGSEAEVVIKNSEKKNVKNISENISKIITNPKKILFPELKISKIDLVNYFQKVSEYLLPHLYMRPLSLYRLPNGIHANGFFQKDKGNLKLPDYVESTKIYSESNDKNIEYIMCNNNLSLAYINNLASIELHAWLSRIPNLEHPDFVLLDLDPDENDFDELIEIAQFIHALCDKLGFANFVKTSGKSGLHIYLPLEENTTFEQSKLIAEILMTIVHRNFPDNTSIERATSKRKHKIYLDFLQNRHAQTVVVPYSLRPVADASVSMPLRWEELKPGLRPKDFNIENVPEILSRDSAAWSEFGKQNLKIEESFEKLKKRYDD